MGLEKDDPGAIIIPAYNEAEFIDVALRALLSCGTLRKVKVVVAANGCTDNTAEIARKTLADVQASSHVQVLDLPEGSKIKAIRAAEALLPPGARLYLDADAICPAETAVSLLRAVGATPTDAPVVKVAHQVAVPSRKVDTSKITSAATRAFTDYFYDLPWVKQQTTGRAAYALSADIRATFDEFPDVVADDRWATASLSEYRPAFVSESVTIFPAETLPSLLAGRRRVYVGNLNPAVATHDASTESRARGLLRTATQPAKWPGLATFVVVNAIAKQQARADVSAGRVTWSQDHSTQDLPSSQD